MKKNVNILRDGEVISIPRDHVFPNEAEDLLEDRLDQARNQCRYRILAAIDDTAQKNLTAAAVAGLLNGKRANVFKDGVEWIQQMRAAWKPLAEDMSKDIGADENWPTPSQDVKKLAASF